MESSEWRLTPGGGGTLNVEVIGCSSEIFLDNLKKYPGFDFKTPKKYPNCNFEGCFEKHGFHFPKIFQNTKIRILYPKKYDKHTYHFTMEVLPPPSPGLTSENIKFHARNMCVLYVFRTI